MHRPQSPSSLPHNGPHGRSGRARWSLRVTLGLGLCVLPALSACRTAEPEPNPEANRRGSMEELSAMLRGGAKGEVKAEVRERTETAPPTAPARAAMPAGSLQNGGDAPVPVSLPAAAGADLGPPEGGAPTAPPADDDQLEQGIGNLGGAGQALIAPMPFTGNPYLIFGERIIPRADGRITKPYPLPVGRGQKLLHMMALFGGFPLDFHIVKADNVPDGNSALLGPGGSEDPNVVQVVLLEKWDVELYQDFSSPSTPNNPWPGNNKSLEIADWFVVTAAPNLLLDVESFINLFAASVPQIEIEASVVEVTDLDELDYGVRQVGDDPIFGFPDGTFVKSLGYSVPNSVDQNEALLQIGAIQDGVVFNAILEAIQGWENVEITTQPRIAVREGGVAEILNTQDIPFFSFSGISATGNFTANLQYKEVGVKLSVAPRVVGTNTLALNLFIEASQQIGTSISFVTDGGSEIAAPVIAKRQARTVVYLEQGQAIVLGGLVSERTVEVQRKVPVLGDLPLLGLLFRSDRTRKERTNVLFFIRPRILQGADFNRVFPDLRQPQ